MKKTEKTKNQAAQALRAIPSEKRSAASRENGKLGGRPRTMSYRADVDFIDHEESKKFSSKTEAFAFAREWDWEVRVYRDFGERDGWQKIGQKDRYSKRVQKVEY